MKLRALDKAQQKTSLPLRDNRAERAFAFPAGRNFVAQHLAAKNDHPGFRGARDTAISVSPAAQRMLAQAGLTLGDDGVVHTPSGDIDLRGTAKANEEVSLDVSPNKPFTVDIRARESGERGIGEITSVSLADVGGHVPEASRFEADKAHGGASVVPPADKTLVGDMELWRVKNPLLNGQVTQLTTTGTTLKALKERGYALSEDAVLHAPDGAEIDLRGTKKGNMFVELKLLDPGADEFGLRFRENNFAPWQNLTLRAAGGFELLG